MLKSLELFGFKSFADRTRFEFARGVTCVVGPNGSGKSNVVDAMKWILGDQSPKSLRGKEMTDVIFNGSSGRSGSGFAEATLTFDNSAGFLPTDSQEVRIGRRIWRNGDSEYLINNASSRLRDIRDLFMGTGAATSAYSIIEQGRVDQILQANASMRRAVFEEAAGVSRYKARKTEALRKLERVSQNLLRLTDIVDEVEAQLNSTRSQAAKAAKYRDVSQELREVWLGLAADDFRHLSARLAECESAIAESESKCGELNQQQEALEGRLATFDTDIARVDDRLRQVERQVAANRETMAGHKATVRHQTARMRELDAEFGRLREQRSAMAARSQAVIEELQQAREQVDRFEQAFADEMEQLATRDSQIHEFADQINEGKRQIDQQRAQFLELTRRISECNNRVAGLESQRESTRAAHQSAISRRDSLASEIATCKAECETRQERVDQVLSKESAVAQNVRELRQAHDKLVDEQDQSQQRLAAHREQRSAWEAQRGLLDDLEHRQEGLGIGVREILRRAETLDSTPWNRILGTVADLLEVDLEDAALLEVALGSRAQLLVLDDQDPLVEYLSSGPYQISGRVGFMAITNEVPLPYQSATAEEGHSAAPSVNSATASDNDAPTELPDLLNLPGIVKRADQLTRSNPAAAPHLAQQLLADTWIVKTLQTAIELSDGPGRGCRFVTLQGELLEADGTLLVGTVHRENALVSRKSELRRLRLDLTRLDQTIADEERTLAQTGESVARLAEQLETVLSEKHGLNEKLSKLRAHVASRRQELEKLCSDHAAVEAEIVQHADNAQQIEKDLESAQMQAAQTEEDLNQLQQDIDQRERELSRLEHRRQLLEKKQATEKLRVAKEEQRLTSLRETFGRLDEERRQRAEQRAEAERRHDVTFAKRRQTVLQILNTSAVLSELALTAEQLAATVAQFVGQKSRLREQRTQLSDEEATIRQQRRDLSENEHAEQMRVRDFRHQINTLEERIDEEYQLALPDIVASGVSAFLDHIEKNRQQTPAASRPATSQGQNEETEGTEESTHDHGEPDSIPSEDVDATDTTERTVLLCKRDGEETICFEDIRDEIESRVKRLQRKRKLMGNVNTDSLRDLDELDERCRRLNDQLQDLEEAKSTLEQIVTKINSESRRLFAESFEAIRMHFQELFRKLFGGGDADIVLEDPSDVLECGIDIVARPPGKELRSISLLSGGEKTLTAVALLLAIFKSRPSPFCILDEVDAALDEANVDRYSTVVKGFQDTTQFIVITHNKRTMTIADVMYGVTMEQSGVSKRMAVRFEDVSDTGEIIKTDGRKSSQTEDRAIDDAA